MAIVRLDPELTGQARALREHLESELRALGDESLCLSVAALHDDNSAITSSAFSSVGPCLAASERRLASAHVLATRTTYNAFVMAALIERFDSSSFSFKAPACAHDMYRRELGRMLAHAVARSAYLSDIDSDGVRKDLALLAGRLIPIGAGVATPGSGMARSTAWQGDLSQALRFIRVMARSGGAQSWLEIHTHTDSLSEFNPDGWERTYRRCAEWLRANPAWRGVCRASWFLDPGLRSISPNLNYMADLPLGGGADLFFVQNDTLGTSGALQTSQRRRQLFASGQYVPRIHLMAWPRQALLHWAAARP
jgi:hypothetical protein